MVRRTYTYIVFGVGVLLIVAAALLKIPGGIVAGAVLAIFGLLLFGLSFIPQPGPPADAPARMSFLEQLTGIFFEPSRVFQNLRAHPRWLFALLLIVALNFAYSVAFVKRLTPERIVAYNIDKVAERGWIPADKVDEIKQQQIEEAKSPARLALGLVPQIVATFVLSAIVAALILLAVMLFGGRIGFWQALAVAIYSAIPITIISKILSLVLLYVKDPDEIHPVLGQQGLLTDNLGVLFKPAENPVLFSIASSFGLLAFYWVWLRAVGIRNGGEKITSGTAWTISIAFWVIGLLFVVALSALFPNFIS
jgi:hypothetical protein